MSTMELPKDPLLHLLPAPRVASPMSIKAMVTPYTGLLPTSQPMLEAILFMPLWRQMLIFLELLQHLFIFKLLKLRFVLHPQPLHHREVKPFVQERVQTF